MYAPVIESLLAAGIVPHYSVNVTGHGWRKLMRHKKELTYRIFSLPAVPPVLSFMQSQAALSHREAYGTFNMGAGFAVFVEEAEVAQVISIAGSLGISATHAGRVEAGDKQVSIEPLNVVFDANELRLRV